MLPKDVLFSGGVICSATERLKNEHQICLDSGAIPAHIPAEGAPINTYPCHFEGGNQLFIFSRYNEVRHLSSTPTCLTAYDVRKSGPSVKLNACLADFHRNQTAPPGKILKFTFQRTIEYVEQQWIFKDGRLYNEKWDGCLTVINEQVTFAKCADTMYQKFFWST